MIQYLVHDKLFIRVAENRSESLPERAVYLSESLPESVSELLLTALLTALRTALHFWRPLGRYEPLSQKLHRNPAAA